MTEHETIADIIAEKRRKADELEASSYRPHQFLRERIAELRQEVDRLEAAHRRDTKELRVEIERLKEERNYSGVRERERLRAKGFAIVPKEQLERGDAAKLREAVAKCVNLITEFGNAEIVKTPLDVIVDIEAILNAALSAPPRNCDVMDWRTAWKIWREKFHPETPVGYSAVVKGTEAFMDWFTAPVAEKKGGDDGNE